MVSVVAKKTSASSIIEFKTIRYNEENYSPGDIVMIKEHSDDASFGTLVSIWKRADQNDAVARIRWLYKPADIFQKKREFLSEFELFDSDHEQDIPVMSLYGKATLLSYEEYHALDEVDSDVFFTRAKYFTKEKRIRPPFEEWKTGCVCNSILNPDMIFVACDKCEQLFHPKCVEIEGKEDEEWICFRCLINNRT